MQRRAGREDRVAHLSARNDLRPIPENAVGKNSPLTNHGVFTYDIAPGKRDIASDLRGGCDPKTAILEMNAGPARQQVPIRLTIRRRRPCVLQIAAQQRAVERLIGSQQRRKDVFAEIRGNIGGDHFQQRRVQQIDTRIRQAAEYLVGRRLFDKALNTSVCVYSGQFLPLRGLGDETAQSYRDCGARYETR